VSEFYRYKIDQTLEENEKKVCSKRKTNGYQTKS